MIPPQLVLDTSAALTEAKLSQCWVEHGDWRALVAEKARARAPRRTDPIADMMAWMSSVMKGMSPAISVTGNALAQFGQAVGKSNHSLGLWQSLPGPTWVASQEPLWSGAPFKVGGLVVQDEAFYADALALVKPTLGDHAAAAHAAAAAKVSSHALVPETESLGLAVCDAHGREKPDLLARSAAVRAKLQQATQGSLEASFPKYQTFLKHGQ